MRSDMPAQPLNAGPAQPQIYVVDDEPLLLELAEAVLAHEGLRVRTFSDPAEAVLAFASANPRPGLLLTDYAMGAMNGIELIEKCRELEPGLQVILVSGTVDKTITGQTAQLIQGFYRKPYDPFEMGRAARALLGL